MRLPADEIGHPRRDRLLHDEVMGEARQRTPDENQARHRQKLTAMGAQRLIRARRTQHVDERDDEAQGRDYDQRDDQTDLHQRGDKRPNLSAIAAIVADEARRRHAFIVLAKRVEAGFKETEHGLGPLGIAAQAGFGNDGQNAAELTAGRRPKWENGIVYGSGLRRSDARAWG